MYSLAKNLLQAHIHTHTYKRKLMFVLWFLPSMQPGLAHLTCNQSLLVIKWKKHGDALLIHLYQHLKRLQTCQCQQNNKIMNNAYLEVHTHCERMWVKLQTLTPREKKVQWIKKNASFMSLPLWPQTPSAAWLVSWQAAFHPEAPERLSLFTSCEHLGRALVLMLSDYHHSLLTHLDK